MAFCLHPHHCPWGTLAWHREGLGLMLSVTPGGLCWRPSGGHLREREDWPLTPQRCQ